MPEGGLSEVPAFCGLVKGRDQLSSKVVIRMAKLSVQPTHLTSQLPQACTGQMSVQGWGMSPVIYNVVAQLVSLTPANVALEGGQGPQVNHGNTHQLIGARRCTGEE